MYTSIDTKRSCAIAEARNGLTEIVHEVERGLLIGGYAVSWTTKDIDFLVATDADDRNRLAAHSSTALFSKQETQALGSNPWNSLTL
jgi:hypothetical protein